MSAGGVVRRGRDRGVGAAKTAGTRLYCRRTLWLPYGTGIASVDERPGNSATRTAPTPPTSHARPADPATRHPAGRGTSYPAGHVNGQPTSHAIGHPGGWLDARLRLGGVAEIGMPSAGPAAPRAGFAVAGFHVNAPADTFLALPGSARGFVWVNGFPLGRYRDIGPQITLYCPAPLLRAGENTVTVLELERLGESLELRDRPELGHPEEYVEEFD